MSISVNNTRAHDPLGGWGMRKTMRDLTDNYGCDNYIRTFIIYIVKRE